MNIELDEEQPSRKTVRFTASQCDLVHRLVVALMCYCALSIAFWESGGWMHPAVYFFLTLCIGGLYVGRKLGMLMVEFFAPFQYREKFALFLGHLVLMGIPWYLGFKGWNYIWSVLLALQCGQTINRVVFGRLYAVSFLLLFGPLCSGIQPPFVFVTSWMLFLLLAMRLKFLNFRLLESRHPGRSLAFWESIRFTIPSVFLPWTAAVALYFWFAVLLQGKLRVPQFDEGVWGKNARMGPVEYSDLIWDAVFIMAIIIGLLVLMYWIEHQLQKLRSAEGTEIEDMYATHEGRDEVSGSEPKPLEEPFGDDARGRILARFRAYYRQLGQTGWGRRSDETVWEYLNRLATELLHNEPIPSTMGPLFDRACYSSEAISNEEAEKFLRAADESERQMMSAVESKRAEKANEPK